MHMPRHFVFSLGFSNVFALTYALFLLLLLGPGVALRAGEAAVGSVAPELGSEKTFNTPGGAPVTLASLRGQVVLIDFWATWCGPCVAAIPHVQELHEKYHDQGLVVIGHTDASSQDLPAFIKQKKISYIISVGKDIGNAYGVSGIPHVFIIDPDGKIAWQGHPAELQDSTVAELMKKAKPPAPPGPPSPAFAKPSPVAKVARYEQLAATGKVGIAVKELGKLAAADKNPTDAAAAKTSLDVISAWRAARDAEQAKAKDDGDVFVAASIAEVLAKQYAGHDDAKALLDTAAALKKDQQWKAGQDYARLAAIPVAGHADPRFIQQVDAFLKKWPDGYYAEQVKALRSH